VRKAVQLLSLYEWIFQTFIVKKHISHRGIECLLKFICWHMTKMHDIWNCTIYFSVYTCMEISGLIVNIIIPVPRVDRGPIDCRNIRGIIVDKTVNGHKIGTTVGVISGLLSRNQIEKIHGRCPDGALFLARTSLS
jgi:energy-converting hydrogenase Eha subunit A